MDPHGRCVFVEGVSIAIAAKRSRSVRAAYAVDANACCIVSWEWQGAADVRKRLSLVYVDSVRSESLSKFLDTLVRAKHSLTTYLPKTVLHKGLFA